jgi:hypothetical protein
MRGSCKQERTLRATLGLLAALKTYWNGCPPLHALQGLQSVDAVQPVKTSPVEKKALRKWTPGAIHMTQRDLEKKQPLNETQGPEAK